MRVTARPRTHGKCRAITAVSAGAEPYASLRAEVTKCIIAELVAGACRGSTLVRAATSSVVSLDGWTAPSAKTATRMLREKRRRAELLIARAHESPVKGRLRVW